MFAVRKRSIRALALAGTLALFSFACAPKIVLQTPASVSVPVPLPTPSPSAAAASTATDGVAPASTAFDWSSNFDHGPPGGLANEGDLTGVR